MSKRQRRLPGQPLSASAYVLERSFNGSAEWAIMLVYNQPEHIQSCLDQIYGPTDGPPRPIDIGFGAKETEYLWAVQRGRLTWGVDIHDFLQITCPDGTVHTMAALWRAFDHGLHDQDSDIAELKQIYDRNITIDATGHGSIHAAFISVDWEGLSSVLPHLEEPLLQHRQQLRIEQPAVHPAPEAADDTYLEICIQPRDLLDEEEGEDIDDDYCKIYYGVQELMHEAYGVQNVDPGEGFTDPDPAPE
ncbi:MULTISPECIES: hypothetical protein [unclassified Spirillospora]|uniref:hypothetical protein n=1 Tax=unclassified Spirillospora TaxID=2642701 RepID=UPI00371E9F82